MQDRISKLSIYEEEIGINKYDVLIYTHILINISKYTTFQTRSSKDRPTYAYEIFINLLKEIALAEN